MQFFSKSAKWFSFLAIPTIAFAASALVGPGVYGLCTLFLGVCGVSLSASSIGLPVGIVCLAVAGLFSLAWLATTASPFYQKFSEWGLMFDLYFSRKWGNEHYLDGIDRYLSAAQISRATIEQLAFAHIADKQPSANFNKRIIEAHFQLANQQIDTAKKLLEAHPPLNKYLNGVHKEIQGRINTLEPKLNKLLFKMYDNFKAIFTHQTHPTLSHIHSSTSLFSLKQATKLARKRQLNELPDSSTQNSRASFKMRSL